MLYHSPTLAYCGLTIVLSNPSRLDSEELLSGTGGVYFFNECLKPQFNRWQCDIRLADETRPLLPKTKCILVLGEYALRKLTNDKEAQLNAQRGNLNFHFSTGTILIASYNPQDAVDLKDYEGEHNPLANVKFGESESDEGEGDEKKRYGKTKRKNYRFWLKQDVAKAVVLTLNEGRPPKDYDSSVASYNIYPDGDSVVKDLLSTKGKILFFDKETDEDLNMLCFAYSWNSTNISVVPIVRHDYSKAYSNTAQILWALALAIRDNTLVAHNGANFDYFTLAHKYGIPIGIKVYDTMIAQNRCWPEVEKSLGHCISLMLYEPFHKDEANFAYNSEWSEKQLWTYCGKDVSSMAKLYYAQTAYAKKIPGLYDSILDACSYIRPYLLTCLVGIHYDADEMEAVMVENDKLMNHYVKWLEYLIGVENLKQIRGAGKSDLPSSPKQCVKYFHEFLNYSVVSKTDTGAPSLAADAMYKLKLKGIDNPVIDIVLAYRTKQKESGSLKFLPWKT